MGTTCGCGAPSARTSMPRRTGRLPATAPRVAESGVRGALIPQQRPLRPSPRLLRPVPRGCGRYLTASASPAPTGHRSVQLDFDQAEVEAIMWQVVMSETGDNVLLREVPLSHRQVPVAQRLHRRQLDHGGLRPSPGDRRCLAFEVHLW